MKLSELKAIIDRSCEYAGECDCNVFINIGKAYHDIRAVNQYSVIPDVIIEVGEKFSDDE